jgi:hypothetical protein
MINISLYSNKGQQHGLKTHHPPYLITCSNRATRGPTNPLQDVSNEVFYWILTPFPTPMGSFGDFDKHYWLLFSSFYSWADPGSDLNMFPTKPSKTIDPPRKPKGNTTHIMYCAVSPEIVLWVFAMLICFQFRKEWGYGTATHPLRP